MISGYATLSGTLDWANRHDTFFYESLGPTGLRVSQAGFGGYRISAGIPEHGAALRQALESGINLIDTSANYGDGGSEKLIGEVLAQLITSGRLRREEVVLVSKAGYIQGRNYERSRQRRRRGQPFADLVPYADGLEHCIHPEFLEDQLNRSLQRLGVETLDILLLHNPEYYLGWARTQDRSPDRARAEYMRRIEKAFRHLEAEVAAGRIRGYGISSNTFPVQRTDPQFTCLEKIWQAAESMAADHHFAVIQLPMNLFESGAVLLANQPSGETCLGFARQKGLGVLVNRPLNAFIGNRLVRLADVKDLPRLPDEEIHRRIAVLRTSEESFAQKVLSELSLESSLRSRLENQLQSADALADSWNALQGHDHWRQVRDEILLPRIRGVLYFLGAEPTAGSRVSRWSQAYQQALEAVLQAIGGYYAAAARQKIARIKALLGEADPDWAADVSLSQLAVRALRSTAGISCVLVGMRREEYVNDVVRELRVPIAGSYRTQAWSRLQTSLAAIE